MDKQNNYYVGISGGVDSSVAAYLLKQEGAKVEGIYANCFYDEDQCRNSQDHVDAVAVAGALNIKLTTKDYRSRYYEGVLKSFYQEYASGRTPNPDILCNSEIKFGVMADDIFQNDLRSCLATGHYVANNAYSRADLADHLLGSSSNKPAIDRVISLIYSDNSSSVNFLLSGNDVSKDQSYFLYRLYDKTENLHRYVFPLAELSKAEVRKTAASVDINVATKPDSQGICFIGNIKLKDFVSGKLVVNPGDVYDTSGKLIGSHSGVQLYTVGQRHGFNINSYSGSPLYIVGKNIEQNSLVVGPRSAAYTSEFVVSDLSFPYGIENFLEEFNSINLSVRIRNLGKKIKCNVSVYKSDSSPGDVNKKRYSIRLSEPEFGVSAGQSAVFYIDRLMLGGGVIESATLGY